MKMFGVGGGGGLTFWVCGFGELEKSVRSTGEA